jgi:squalene-hopene/tetraprenyl-beta-curcumene cyclase
MLARVMVAVFLAIPALAGEWDAKLAARYLDGRAAEWAVWKRAQVEGGACISCHTSFPYLLARPALGRKLGEAPATEFESGLLAGVKTRGAKAAVAPPPENAAGTDAILAAAILTLDDARRGGALVSDTEAALRRMWSLQLREGPNKGAWRWAQFDLEPWETPESVFYGAALAAVATGAAPDGYQGRPEIRPNLDALRSYLRATQERQPLANRLLLLWAATRWKGLLDQAERQQIVEAAWKKQGDDGAWTLTALGPWRDRPHAPPQDDSNAYATGLAAFLLKQAGTPTDDARLRKALDWLRKHQDAREGFWDAASMNKRYEAGSMQERFMRDAATAYAVLALAGE